MGNDNSASKKNIKPVIIAIAAVLVIVAAFLLISNFVKTEDSFDEALSGDSLYAPVEQQTDVQKNETTTKPVNDMADSSIVDKNSNSTDVTNNHQYEIVEREDNKQPSAPKFASSLVKGAKASDRWEASSVISKVLVEKIPYSLPVYEKGVKTGESKTRNIYIAEITTRPSRVSVVAASQFVDGKVADINDFVRNYESQTEQDILFASNNEMCARDYDNPMGNIFYNGDDSLTATVIKNGVIAQRGDASKDSLVIYKDGSWKYPVSVSMSSAEKLIKDGAIASVSYTYPVIWEGKKYNHPDCGVNTGIWTNHSLDPETNHSLIGKSGTDKYYVVVGEGCGMGYLAEIMMNDLGVEYAYWGNGGAAAAMYVKGYGIVTSHDYIVHGDFFCVR